ncbi:MULTISPECIES: hypothetical protein [unclassified Rhizobium]|uniref:hypothetical protein n=1 Tax=unclassified Rhizobium TaxID=2613769 RepID=UPI000BA864E4|nr:MULTISPECIES: hypothetical protein [unclassified Rhizobium]ASW04719.1 hypothetical protein CKA34_01550 [Rhizobium sp. 11515TR]MDK4713519.1 hypothetical protein [Rhizobium sp. CNPSo 4039]
MIPARFCAVRDAAWSWSVIDITTGKVVVYSAVRLGGLSELIAKDMAKLLNLESSDDNVVIPLSPESRET